MTTSVLTQFDLIQYFAALDPYSYSVDNRPLADLKQNINALASAHDASLDAAKMAVVAAGMLARGIVGENVMVGKKSLGSMNVVINNGVFVKEGEVYGSDINSQSFPKLGLQQESVVFSLTAPPTPGDIRYFTISARFQSPDNTLSFYDNSNANVANSVELGTVEYDDIQENTVTGAFDTSHFPDPASGFYALFHVAVPEGTSSLTSDMVTNVNFVDDLSRAYDSYSFTTTGSDLIEDIPVNVNYALVFADGVFQNSDQYTILAADTIQWNSAIDAGVNLDFVVLRGGSSGGGGGGDAVYAYEYDSVVVPPGPDEDTFAVSPPLDYRYVFVFVNGVFQSDIDRGTPGQVVLPAAVPAGTVVDFVQTIGGSALPESGVSGQSVHRSGAGPDNVWQNEVLSVQVGSATGTEPVAYVAAAVNFEELFDLYDGRQIVLLDNGGFSTTPTNGAEDPTVTLQIDSKGALPVLRPGGLPLKNNDIYEGAIVTYRTTHYELVNPGMPDVMSNYSSVIGDENDIEVTPDFTILRVPNGALLSIYVPSDLGGNTLEVCSLKVNYATGNLTAPIGKMNGSTVVGLRPGDICGDRNHLFQYDAALGYFILLNPANSPVLEVAGAKRQTVISGHVGETNKSYLKVTPATPTSSSLLLPSLNPTALEMSVSGPAHNLRVKADTLISFANGFDGKGPIDYVENVASATIVEDMAGEGHGITSANLTSIAKSSTNSTLTLTYSTDVHTIPVGAWVRVRGMVGSASVPLVGMNGVYYVEGDGGTGDALVLSCLCDATHSTSTGIASTVVDRVYFVYAERDDDGVVTFGLNDYRPLYVRGLSEELSSPIDLGLNPHIYEGQNIFDIEAMKMYTVNGAGYLLPVNRVYIGEYYAPDALSTPDASNCRTYEYNGKYTAYIPSYNDASYAPLVYSAVAYCPFNVLDHGMGTYLYEVKITALQESLSAGRKVGALMGAVPYYQMQGQTQANPIIVKSDCNSIAFTLNTPGISVTSFGRTYNLSASSMAVSSNFVIELERSF